MPTAEHTLSSRADQNLELIRYRLHRTEGRA